MNSMRMVAALLSCLCLASAYAQDRGDLLKPAGIFCETEGEAGSKPENCVDGNDGTWFIPGRMVESSPPISLQIFFDTKATINGLELSQGSRSDFLFRKYLRAGIITAYFQDGSSEEMRLRDSPEATYYTFHKKRKTNFLELRLTEFFPSTENWTCILREIRIFGMAGTAVSADPVNVSALECSKLVEDIYMGMQPKKGTEFPWFNRRASWKVRMAHATWYGGQTGTLAMNQNPVQGGELDENGQLDENYFIYVRFDKARADRYREVWYDAIVILKDRLEWTKALRLSKSKSATFTVSGFVVKPSQAAGVLLDRAEIIQPAFKGLKPEPLPEPEERWVTSYLPDLDEYCFYETGWLVTSFIEEQTILSEGRKTRILSIVGGRVGFAPGEWQPLGARYGEMPDDSYEGIDESLGGGGYGQEGMDDWGEEDAEAFSETDYDELQLALCIHLGKEIREGRIEADKIRFSHRSLDYAITPEDCIALEVMDAKGDSYFKILRYYDSIRERD